MGFDRSEAGKEIGLMVFTPPAIVNLFRLSGLSSPLLGFCDDHLPDNFVYEIYFPYNFVTRCLRSHCLSPSQPSVLVGKQVSNRHGTLLAMGKRE